MRWILQLKLSKTDMSEEEAEAFTEEIADVMRQHIVGEERIEYHGVIKCSEPK